jgi:hypothetical protein
VHPKLMQLMTLDNNQFELYAWFFWHR